MNATVRTKLISVLSELEAGDFADAYYLMREAHGRVSRATLNTIHVGSDVSFDAGRGRGYLTGKVIKINRTTVSVRVSSGVIWKVSGSLLKQEA